MYPQQERTWSHTQRPPGQPTAPQQYYNFPGNLPPDVGQQYKQAVDAQRFVDKNTIQNVQPSPIASPPYKGLRLELFSRAVVGPVAGDAEATAGATAVANAMSRFGTALTVITPTSATDYVTVLTYTVPVGSRAVFTGVGVWAHDYWATDDNAALFKVNIGRAALFDPVPLGAMGDPTNITNLFYVAKEKDVIQVQVLNQDARSGLAVEARLDGWYFPVLQQDDSLQSLINNQTIESNGRFSVGVYCPPYPPAPNCAPPANVCNPCPPPRC